MSSPPRRLPLIHRRETQEFGGSRREWLDLEFSNGERRRYHRILSPGHGSVLVAPIPEPGVVLLVREYAAGTHRYELGLPKGRMDAGETVLEAANRELKEEAGFGARKLTALRAITLAPTYMNHEIHLVLAEDLYPERLPGDEPEELEVVPWKFDRLADLMLREDCSEGRSLASLFIVSGISGSKVSDMATVAPALFPEMRRRGNKQPEMVALLATGAAMADTVPPSIVLIVLGSVAGVSIAGLFESGFFVAMVLLLALLVLARWKARHEVTESVQRPSFKVIGRLLLIAAPALVLPFLIRSAVGGGVATATEVSTIAVLYAMLTGQVLYGGIGWKRAYAMLVETAALSGAILLILGTASAMAWAITQSGIVQQLSTFLTTLPGGWMAFMAVTVVVFLILGCLLEGLPAVLLLAPIMFPIAKKLGIHDIHYSMVIVCAMNVGLMMPPIGVGFYIACRIGDAKPDDVIVAIWPYIAALLVGVVVIAAIPALSTFML